MAETTPPPVAPPAGFQSRPTTGPGEPAKRKRDSHVNLSAYDNRARLTDEAADLRLKIEAAKTDPARAQELACLETELADVTKEARRAGGFITPPQPPPEKPPHNEYDPNGNKPVGIVEDPPRPAMKPGGELEKAYLAIPAHLKAEADAIMATTAPDVVKCNKLRGLGK